MRRAPPRPAPAGYLRFARLGRSFKLDGGVRLQIEAQLSDEELAALLQNQPKLHVEGLGDTRLRAAESRSGAIVVHLEGVRDREAARALVNAGVWADASLLPSDVADRPENAADGLVGMPVRVDGTPVGDVEDAFLDLSNPYVAVRLSAGGTALVPLTAPYVDLTDDALELTDPPPGLLE